MVYAIKIISGVIIKNTATKLKRNNMSYTEPRKLSDLQIGDSIDMGVAVYKVVGKDSINIYLKGEFVPPKTLSLVDLGDLKILK